MKQSQIKLFARAICSHLQRFRTRQSSLFTLPAESFCEMSQFTPRRSPRLLTANTRRTSPRLAERDRSTGAPGSSPEADRNLLRPTADGTSESSYVQNDLELCKEKKDAVNFRSQPQIDLATNLARSSPENMYRASVPETADRRSGKQSTSHDQFHSGAPVSQ